MASGDLFDSTLSGIQKISRELATRGINGTGEVVGLIDSGLDINLSVFYDPSVEFKYDETNHAHRKVLYYYTYMDKTDFNPGHGTYLAAAMAGKTDAEGGSLYNGVAPEAKIVFTDNGNTRSPSVYKLDYNMQNTFSIFDRHQTGVVLHAWSIALSDWHTSTIQREINRMTSVFKNVLAVTQAGDTNQNTRMSSPGTTQNALTVGAAESDKGPAADFSYCKSPMSLLIKPDVITSGVLTSFASDGLDSKVRGYDPSQLREFTGTSGAAALVGGAATLIRQYFRSGFYPTGHAVSENGFTPSAMLLKASVIQSAEYQNNESRPDACSGYGQVNLKKVLHFSDDNNKMRVVDNVVIRPHSHISTSVTFTPDGATDFSATLSWYHIPSTETVADVSHIVIMHVITPSGKILFGNKGNVTVDDLISLNQKVFIPAHKVEKGVYTIHIICEKANKEVDTTGAFIINGPIDDTETPSSLTFADDMTCSNSCSSHGTCNNGLCECEEDYYGSVCSVKSMKLHLNELDFFQLDPFEYRTFYLEIPARGPGSYYGFKMGGEHATVMITESPRNSLADSISKFSLIPGYDNTIKMGYAMENISAQYARVFFFSHQNQRGYYRIEPIIDLNVKTPTPSMSPSVSPSATFDEPTAAPTDKSSFVKTPAFIATVSVLGVVVICVGVFLALKWRKPAELSTLHENMV